MSKSSVLVMIAYIHIIVDNRGFGTWHVKQTLGIRELGIALSAKFNSERSDIEGANFIKSQG